jgi:glucokinase
MILAGDLGGTKANLGLFETRDGKLALVASRRYPSRGHSSAEEIAQAFLRETGASISAACFAVAGPVIDNRVHVTNLPWSVDGGALARHLGLASAKLLNDLEATACGLRTLPPGDFEILKDGERGVAGSQVLIAAGTGLGASILVWDGKQHVVAPCEAGHAGFSPRTEQEIELLRFLMRRKNPDPVSIEMILSGRGFRCVHEFLAPGVRHPSFDGSDEESAPDITHGALEGSCDICVETVRMWCSIYGSEAGNLAIRVVARGGAFVAGGIAVKILPFLRDGRFNAAFVDKDKMQYLLAALPVYLVKNEEAPLWGAAWVAAHPGTEGL